MDPGVKLAAGVGALATCVCLMGVLWSDSGGVAGPEPSARSRGAPARASSLRPEQGARRAGPPAASISDQPSAPPSERTRLWPPEPPRRPLVATPPRLAREYPRPRPGASPEGGLRRRAEAVSATAPASPSSRREPAQTTVRRHEITDGDTLPGLAERYLGSAERYLEIYEQNQDVLHNPDELPIGVELEIPTGNPLRYDRFSPVAPGED